MKKIKSISIMMILAVVMLAISSCGGGISESEAKPSRDGFDASTNKEIEFGGMVFSVPDYCDFQENEDGDLETMLEEDRGMILIGSTDSELSDDEFASGKAELIKKWNEKIEAETANDDGTFVTSNDSGVELTGKSDMLLNSDNGKLIILVLYQSENAEYDYMSDFNAIIASAHKAEKTTSDDNSDSGDRAETDISPEFKATMDKYEEFFDEYVDFMNKYKENPTDVTLLAESADMLTKEAEMMKEMEAMDESEMTTAESAYYLEVTARIYSKLSTVMQ